MGIVIKAQSSSRAQNGVGKLSITIDGKHRIIKAVIFSRSQSTALLNAADNAKVIISERKK